jgi:hypothetical protein
MQKGAGRDVFGAVKSRKSKAYLELVIVIRIYLYVRLENRIPELEHCRSSLRMPFPEPETALASTIGAVAGEIVVRDSEARPLEPAKCLRRFFNHLHEGSTTYPCINRSIREMPCLKQ